MSAPLYPLFLRLEGKRIFVVGGGAIATRRIERLIEAGALVTFQAPDAAPRLTELATAGVIEWQRTKWDGAIPDCLLCIAATDDPELNRTITEEAERRGVLAADSTSDGGGASIPAVVDRGAIAVAISTGGSSPVLARRIREELEQVIGPEYSHLAALLERLRRAVREQRTQPERAALYEAIASRDVLDMLRAGKEGEAANTIREELRARGFTADEYN